MVFAVFTQLYYETGLATVVDSATTAVQSGLSQAQEVAGTLFAKAVEYGGSALEAASAGACTLAAHAIEYVSGTVSPVQATDTNTFKDRQCNFC